MSAFRKLLELDFEQIFVITKASNEKRIVLGIDENITKFFMT